ncbi:flagellar hook-length control protein [Mycobacterium sp. smrl_JER01]|uniref:flagellar hook-length control protein n=1 Tax=Mycobacterium sp. smrl_JER01 TaxID=3402633 RepID=UPI003AC72E6E
MTTTTDDIIRAATSVARDAAEGRLTPADIERQAVEELSALMLIPADPGTALADLRIEVARRVLAEGGLPADEVAEWLAVQRRRENPNLDAVAAPDALQLPDGPDVLPADVAAVLDDLDPESDHAPDYLAGVDHANEDPVPIEPFDADSNDGYVPPQRGAKFGGHIAARGFGTPTDNGPHEAS